MERSGIPESDKGNIKEKEIPDSLHCIALSGMTVKEKYECKSTTSFRMERSGIPESDEDNMKEKEIPDSLHCIALSGMTVTKQR